MDRRSFLRTSIAAAGGAALVPAVSMVAPAGAGTGTGTAGGEGPYGPLSTTPDANGLLLPEGFTSRVVATSGEEVADTGYVWGVFPDGAATFADGEGGWYHVVNHEVFIPVERGGASAIHYDADGEIIGAASILQGTTANCAGGPTPWGTWLSCEERFDEQGQVWECDPTGERPAEVRPALGRWAHEAAAVDPDEGMLYLTQDHAEGLLYRFRPTAYPDLSSGVLEAAIVDGDGAVTWGEVADPSGESAPTRTQVPGATVFPGNEGIWYHDGTIVFTSKFDNRVHAIDLRAQRYELLWDGTPAADLDAGLPRKEPLAGVDNITVSAESGDLFVAEDGDDMQVVLIATEGDVVPFAQVVAPGHEDSEITGPAFDPSGTRLYFSSQRGPTARTPREIAGAENDDPNAGITYEVTGPFRGAALEVAAPATTLATAAAASTGGDDDSSAVPLVIGAGVVVAGAGAAGVLWARNRRTNPS